MNNLLEQVVNNNNNGAEGTANRLVHIFFDGQAWDLSFDELDIGMLSADAEIKNKVAEALDCPVIKLANFRVERNEVTEDVTLTPQATFGIPNLS